MTLKTQQSNNRMDGEEGDAAAKNQKDTRKSNTKTEQKVHDYERPESINSNVSGGEQVQTKKGKEILKIEKNNDDIPLVRIHQATPSPRPHDLQEDMAKDRKLKRKKRKEKEERADGLDEDDEFDEDDDDEEEDEEVEEEEVETEMTPDEKKTMYEAVIEGDIEALEDCLDLPNSDINMIWFHENVLMAAIRAGHVDVCEFLLDNGVDHTFSTSVVDIQEGPTGKVMERYEVDCRQMAYDRDLQETVFLIDVLQGNIFPFIPQPARQPRLRRPKPEPSEPTDSEEDDSDDEKSGSTDTGERSSDSSKRGQQSGTNTPGSKDEMRRKKKKKVSKKKQSQANSAVQDNGVKGDNSVDEDDDGIRTATIVDDDEDGEKDKTFRTLSTFGDVDSGNYSMTSSKLKKNMLQKHDRLLEKEERSASSTVGSPRKSESDSAQTKSQSLRVKGDKSDRTSTTFTHDESQSLSAPAESVVPSLSTEIPKWAAVLNPPTNRIRSNRATTAARQGNLSRNFYKSPLHASTVERPLQWRKISSPGSYTTESKRWRLESKIEEANNERVQISQLRLAPSTPSSSTASASFPSKSQMSLRSSGTPSDISDSLSLSSASISDRFDRYKVQRSISKQSSSPAQNPAVEVASYMRPTQSTITKQRLGTQFVDSYGGLDFCTNPSKSGHFKTGLPKSSRKLQVTGSHKVPILSAKSVSQRRNENAISYRV